MRKKIILFIGWIIFWKGLTFALDSGIYIGEISFIGNQVIPSQEIKKNLKIKEETLFDEQILTQDIEFILNLYKEKGYLFTRVEVEKQERIEEETPYLDLTFHIYESQPVVIGEIKIIGNQAFPESTLMEFLPISSGEVFSRDKFEKGIINMLKFYRNQGYPFTTIRPEIYDIQDNKIFFVLKVEECEQMIIKDIEIEGNNKTKDYLIIRESRLKVGEIYNEQKVKDVDKRLQRLNFIDFKEVKILPVQDGIKVIIVVQERKSNVFDGVAGYTPPDTEGKGGGWLGLADLSFANIRGTGRKCRLYWDRPNQQRQVSTLEYQEPWIFGEPFSLGINFTREDEIGLKKDNQEYEYHRQEWGLSFLTPFSVNFNGTFRFGGEDIKIEPEFPDLKSSFKYKLAFDGQYNNVDYIRNPRRGQDCQFTTEVNLKTVLKETERTNPNTGQLETISEPAVEQMVRAKVSFSNFWEIFENQVLMNNLTVGTLFSPAPIPVYEHWRLGGARTLRGYKEDQFRGDTFLLLRNEYRFLVAQDSSFYFFCDAGAIGLPGEKIEISDFTKQERGGIGYGLGLKILTGIGIISLDYGLELKGSLTNGKIHLSIETMF